MYSELTPRVLLGGFVSSQVYADVLFRSGVTHIVNASEKPLPEIVSRQFWTIEIKDANRDDEQKPEYWPEVFSFTYRTLKKKTNIMYFHVTPENASRPSSPVAVYAALRAMGFSPLESRRRLLEAHPIVNWHERAIGFVDASFYCWCHKNHIKPHCEKAVRQKAVPTAEVELGELLDGAMEWTQ